MGEIRLRQEIGECLHMHCNNQVTVKPCVYMQLVGNQISLLLSAMLLKQCWHTLSVLMIYNTAA